MDEWGPEKIVQTWDPKTKTRGILVIDNTARGPGKGGIRLQPDVTVGEVFHLSRVMTWKNALADLPFGGAKAGIVGSPKGDKIAKVKAFASGLKGLVPSEYIAGPDMGTGQAEMAAFANEIGVMNACTGKPHALGGIPRELGSTGFGVVEAIEVAAKDAGISLSGATVAIEGYGNVGTFVHRFICERGAVVVAVSDSHGATYNPKGLDYGKLLHTKWRSGSVASYKGGKPIPAAELFAVDADILVPAARGGSINEGNAAGIKAKLVAEGSNIPMSEKIEQELHDRGVLVVPDFVANAGGVISSYAEHIGADEKRMFEMVSEKVRANTGLVLLKSRRDGVTPHDAAMEIAQERVRKAMRYRGRA